MPLSNLLIRATTKPGVVPAATAALGFGKFFSDHMLTRSWSKSGGWAAPQIEPFGNLSLPPQSSVLHYGACVFEGMKAYKDAQGRVRLFRPDKNMDRLKKSAHRLALPDDCPDMLESIKRLVLLDQRFIPSVDGYSLYIRPTIIGTHQNLGVAVSESALFFTITGPVGPYYPEGFKPISLFADTTHARACEGGVGNAKCGGK
jgi:branched-chain amino acid aminotransferase